MKWNVIASTAIAMALASNCLGQTGDSKPVRPNADSNVESPSGEPLDKVAETTRLLKDCDDVEKRYVDACVKNGGRPPQMNVTDPTGLRKGDMGVPVSKGDGFRVNQIINRRELLVHGNTLWVEGVDTDGVVTDATITLKGVFVVSGTKQYTTVLGAGRTVQHLVALDTTKADKVVQQLMELAVIRNWSKADGAFFAAAQFIDSKGGNVRLKRMGDAATLDVPRSSLSEEDQKWVRAELKRRSDAKQKEAERKRKEQMKRSPLRFKTN